MGDKNKTAKNFQYVNYNGLCKDVLIKHLDLYADLVTVLPSGTRMPGTYVQHHEQYQSFQSRASDVWVASYPKAGTTWTQEMVWCLLFQLDDTRISRPLTERFPFFEWDCLFPERYSLKNLEDGDINKTGEMWRILNYDLPEPRTIKTHLHYDLLPASVDIIKPKIIHICRDPRDVCVSLYYHSKQLDGYSGNFDEFVDLFLDGALPWSSYWSNVLSFWQRRKQDNVLFLTYEDMMKNLTGCVKDAAAFLGAKRGNTTGKLTTEELHQLAEHLSFSSMRKNPAVNNENLMTSAVNTDTTGDVKFMRKGTVGDHKNHLSEQQLNRFRAWTESSLQGSDFPYYRDP